MNTQEKKIANWKNNNCFGKFGRETTLNECREERKLCLQKLCIHCHAHMNRQNISLRLAGNLREQFFENPTQLPFISSFLYQTNNEHYTTRTVSQICWLHKMQIFILLLLLNKNVVRSTSRCTNGEQKLRKLGLLCEAPA